MITPNLLAHLALLSCPVIVLILFYVLPPFRAAAIAFTLAPMLLPKRLAYDFPGLPPIDRSTMVCIAVGIGCALFAPSRFKLRRPLTGIDSVLVVVVLSVILSVLSNSDAVDPSPAVHLRGLTFYDGLEPIFGYIVTLGIPFIAGRALLKDANQIRLLLAVVAGAALIYVLPILWELRMSPQLHRIVYGITPSRFVQLMRGGGYRPIVFMGHGLTLGMFLCVATMSAAALWRVRRPILGVPASVVTVILLVILVASKNRAALAYAVALVPVILFLNSRRRSWVAIALAVLVLAYPPIRAVGVVPVDSVLGVSADVFGEEARDSLAFRFDSEELLLERFNERPLVGWGGFSRNQVFDESGKSLAVFDGFWIIVLSELGYLGFFSVFALLLLPIFAAARARRYKSSPQERLLMSAAACIVGVYGFNLLLNASLPPLAPFLSGALAGLCEGSARSAAQGRRRRRGKGTETSPARARAAMHAP